MNVRITDMQIAKDINYAGVKTCKNCEVEYPATEKYFYRAKGNKDGFRCECKRCTDKAQYQKKVKDLKSLDNVKIAEEKVKKIKEVETQNRVYADNFDEKRKENEAYKKKFIKLYSANACLVIITIIAIYGAVAMYFYK